MIGPRVGLRVGASVGVAAGVSADRLGSQGVNILVFSFGQSNAQSHAPSANLTGIYTPWANTYANVKAMGTQDSTFADDPQVLQPYGPQSLGTVSYDAHTGGGVLPYIGFEQSMMRDLDTALPVASSSGKFMHGRYAIGGAASSIFDPAGTYPTSGGPNVFTQIISEIRSCMAALSCGSVILCWEQGEGDAKTTTAGSAYAAWLESFIDAIRAQLGNLGPGGIEVPFVFGKLNADADAGTYLGLSQLRASQVTVAGARTHTTLVNQDSLTQASTFYDGTHYTANGYVELGHLWSPAVAAFAGVRVQPIASFTDVATALSVAFTDTSVSYGDTITSWLWHFGDGNTSTSQSPTHVYSTGGTYSVTLKATNSAGDSNTTSPLVLTVSGVACTQDATSTWFIPQSVTELNALFTSLSLTNPANNVAIWGMQQASGNSTDLGNASITLTATSSPSFQNAVTGWASKSINFTDASAKAMRSTQAGLPDISTTSQLTFAIVVFPGSHPAAARSIIEQGTSASTRSATLVTTGGLVQDVSTTSHTANGATDMCDSGVHVVVTQTNRTGTTHFTFTEKDKIQATFGSTMTGKSVSLGSTGAGNGALACGVVYAFQLQGADAEMSSADIKTLIQGLSNNLLSVPWS